MCSFELNPIPIPHMIQDLLPKLWEIYGTKTCTGLSIVYQKQKKNRKLKKQKEYILFPEDNKFLIKTAATSETNQRHNKVYFIPRK